VNIVHGVIAILTNCGVFESARARTARCRHGASVCTAPPALSPSVHHEGAELKPAFCTLGHTIPLYLVPSPISLDRQGMQDKPMCGAANKYFLKGEIYPETCKEKKLLKAVLYNSA